MNIHLLHLKKICIYTSYPAANDQCQWRKAPVALAIYVSVEKYRISMGSPGLEGKREREAKRLKRDSLLPYCKRCNDDDDDAAPTTTEDEVDGGERYRAVARNFNISALRD